MAVGDFHAVTGIDLPCLAGTAVSMRRPTVPPRTLHASGFDAAMTARCDPCGHFLGSATPSPHAQGSIRPAIWDLRQQQQDRKTGVKTQRNLTNWELTDEHSENTADAA